MKKICMLISLALILSCQPIAAKTYSVTEKYKPGDVIGHFYSTDIVAYIDDMPIASYNIGGETVVSENDLINYGFQVTWDPKNRTLSIDSGTKPETPPSVNIAKGKCGKILGDVYYTDIHTVLYYGTYSYGSVKAYNIGGETMISLESLGTNSENLAEENYNQEIGYSNLGFKTVWDAKSRKINVYCLRYGSVVSTQYGAFPIVATAYEYGVFSEYDHELPVDFMNIDPTNASQDYDQYYNLTQMINYFNIKCQWENGVFAVTDTINKKDIEDHSASTVGKYGTIIPVVKIPVSINNNGAQVVKNIRCVVYKGELWVSGDFFKDYLFVDPD